MAHSEPLPISLIRRADAVGADAGHTVVWVSGEHDVSTKLALSIVIARAAELDHSDVLVDLSEVTFMDAAIVGTLLHARNELNTQALSLEVRAPSPIAQRVLQLCEVTSLVPARRSGAAPALETWVVVPPQPAVTGETEEPSVVRAPEPVMAAEADRGGR
ncbi:MAG TPA: STAS domain-containing protein [Acidimicrobiales bacterium]|nr:STAS domain-containing protein [Acidimicrobiales bacterium]